MGIMGGNVWGMGSVRGIGGAGGNGAVGGNEQERDEALGAMWGSGARGGLGALERSREQRGGLSKGNAAGDARPPSPHAATAPLFLFISSVVPLVEAGGSRHPFSGGGSPRLRRWPPPAGAPRAAGGRAPACPRPWCCSGRAGAARRQRGRRRGPAAARAR